MEAGATLPSRKSCIYRPAIRDWGFQGSPDGLRDGKMPPWAARTATRNLIGRPG